MDHHENNEEHFDKCYGACINCKDENKCRWLQEAKKSDKIKKCPFDANIDNTKNTKEGCIEQCKNTDELCSPNLCGDLCNNCSDFDKCIWLAKEISTKIKLRDISHPSQPQVEATPFNNSIKITFTVEENGGDPLTKILLIVIKNNEPTLGMRVEKIIPKNPVGGEKQDYLIRNLNNGDQYTIVLAGVNKARGVGPLSNPIIMKPFKYIEAVAIEDPVNDDNKIIEIQRNKLIDRIKKSISQKDFSSLKGDIEKINQIQDALFSETEKGSSNYLDYLSSKNIKVSIS